MRTLGNVLLGALLGYLVSIVVAVVLMVQAPASGVLGLVGIVLGAVIYPVHKARRARQEAS